ncbi:hypothetical protein [Tissierella pigra]|uniref:Uncharacterized protein n=1 Tax=Tissierella pigra TaxID=2607614 RepID=A0A6N7XWS6_9FIRM|nr:hypothetical protein [Tissierella pigra]MSU01903.1 hypothetical protein [Tissierella pigra]
MKAEFDNATIKVWFNSQSTSRNFHNVKEIHQEGNSALIRTSSGDQHLINFANVNMIEEIDTSKRQY